MYVLYTFNYIIYIYRLPEMAMERERDIYIYWIEWDNHH